MIFLYPVYEGVGDILGNHLLLGCKNVAEAGTVVIVLSRGLAVIVVRSGKVESGTLKNESVVVDNVHDNGYAAVMQSLNQHLEFLDTGVAVVRIGRIGALRHVIVLGIVAPVALNGVVGLVN